MNFDLNSLFLGDIKKDRSASSAGYEQMAHWRIRTKRDRPKVFQTIPETNLKK